ncbi:MAG: ABC transporter permease [Clostridiaceae bacterium]|nr:ABC transporter permease [Clostridiaceae bacterium]
MLRMINAEIFKLFKSKIFKVLCLVAVALGVVVILVNTYMNEDTLRESLKTLPEEQRTQMIDSMKNPEGKKIVSTGFALTTSGAINPFDTTARETFNMSFGVGVIEILIVVLVASLFAKEYSEGTIKNILAYGKKREQYYMAKFIAIAVGIAIITLIMCIIPTVQRISVKGIGDGSVTEFLIYCAKVYLGNLILSICTLAFIMLIGTITRNNSHTIIIGLVIITFIPIALGFAYGKFDWFDNIYELSLPYNASLVKAMHATGEDMLKAIFIGVITMLISLTAGISILKKQDIK